MKNKLKDVSLLITKGTTPTTLGDGFTKTGVNFVKSESITNSKYLDSTIFEHISEETNAKMQRSQIKENDLLFSIAGAYLGKIAIVRNCDLPLNTNQAVGIVRIDEEKANVDYLYYFYSQKQMNEYINKLSSQSSQPNLNLELLGNLPLKLLSLNEQNKIAEVLSSIDSKIETNNRINAELESMAKTIYDYWFTQFDFPDENGKPYKSSGGKMAWNEELKREIPEGWGIGNIGDLFESQAGYAFKSEEWRTFGHPVLTIKCINENGTININDSSFIDDYNPKMKKYSVENGNMIFAMSGNTIGKLGIISSSIANILINQRVLILRTNAKTIAFPYFILKNDKIQNSIRQLGANSAQPNISEDAVRSIKICLPTEKMLNSYNNYCESLFEKIILNQIENQQLASLRDWLLPMLMNGQVGFEGVE